MESPQQRATTELFWDGGGYRIESGRPCFTAHHWELVATSRAIQSLW